MIVESPPARSLLRAEARNAGGRSDRGGGGRRQTACLRVLRALVAVVSLAAVLSTESAWATYVCSSSDAEQEALDRWGGQVVEVIYDPDKNGYWVIMIDRRGRERVRFVADDC